MSDPRGPEPRWGGRSCCRGARAPDAPSCLRDSAPSSRVSNWQETHATRQEGADSQPRDADSPRSMRAGNGSQHCGLTAHAGLSGATAANRPETDGRVRLPGAAGPAGSHATQPILLRGRAVVARQRARRPGEGAEPVGQGSWCGSRLGRRPVSPEGIFLVSSFFTTTWTWRKEKIIKANDKCKPWGLTIMKKILVFIEHFLWAWLFLGVISFDPHLILQGKI